LVFDTRAARKTSFAAVVQKAYLARVSLSATGYYATPEIHWDRAAGRGKPFHYFACGAAVTEVEVDGFTGMTGFCAWTFCMTRATRSTKASIAARSKAASCRAWAG
jgi:xanthine dehydrogenase molybdopterin-binding subunit B